MNIISDWMMCLNCKNRLLSKESFTTTLYLD